MDVMYAENAGAIFGQYKRNKKRLPRLPATQ